MQRAKMNLSRFIPLLGVFKLEHYVNIYHSVKCILLHRTWELASNTPVKNFEGQ